ncbi:MAG: 50S ribosomal protein L4 [Deltaproteobacteria bacterium]|nr:50S ribosomal protein L4 [Deltaproteobacteria bacterium]
MAKVDLLDIESKKVGEIDLKDEVFGIQEINQHLFYEVVKAQLASRRSGTAAAKERAAVSGSSKKIYKQKGTGNARHGSKRAPQMYKGGAAHPPIPRSYAYRPPAQVRAGALRHALSFYLKEGRLTVVDKWEPSEFKTKAIAAAIGKLNSNGGSAVVIEVASNEKLRQSTRNLATATFLPPEGVNVYDILRHDHLILTQSAARALEARLGG